jgi:cystathionine gamma-synthase
MNDQEFPEYASDESAAVHALGWRDEASGGTVPPVQPAVTNRRESYATGRIYSRIDGAAYDPVEALLARLEGGADAQLYGSGMAAGSAVAHSLPRGTHVIAPREMYYEMRRLLEHDGPGLGLAVTLLERMDVETIAAAWQEGKTGLVWLETPSNPFWTVTDIAAVARFAHSRGARVVVDGTAATPVLTQPLALGADVVLHAATKYLNGHGDVLAGALVTARRDETWEAICRQRRTLGSVLGAFEAWLLVRGMRTLYLRVRTASANALRIAEHFSTHRGVSQVLYPGLPSHPGHEIAKRQMRGGFGGMLSIRVRAGAEAALEVSARTRLFVRATSFGSVESLIEHRASVEDPASRVPGDLLRLSVGIEPAEDLIADLEQALG